MRVHRIKEVVSGATKQLKTLLSTRTTMRQSDDEQLEGIRQFNTSFQGSSVAVNGGPVRGAVDATHDLTFGFRYPDLEYENTAEIQVKTLPYRIDSQGAAAGGNHTHNVTVGTTTSENTEVSTVDSRQATSSLFDSAPSSWGSLDSFSPASSTEMVILNLTALAQNTSGSNGSIQFRVADESGNYYPDNDFYGTSIDTQNSPMDSGITFVVPGDFQNEKLTLEWQRTDPDDGASWATSWNAFDVHAHSFATTESSGASGNHTHDPNPGIYTTADTPSNVDVLINGSTVATDIGTGTFETTVDIAGDLTNDAWNDIAISSDSLGLAQASVFLEGYDQVGQQ